MRHGESRSNADPERVSLPEEEGDRLTERGHEQARLAAERVAGLGIARLVVSPMRRARETAAPIAARLGLEPEVWEWTHEIREPDGFGELPRAEQQLLRWSSRIAARPADPGYAPDGAESFADLLARVDRTLARLREDGVDRTLLVGHGVFARFAFARTMLGDAFVPALVDSLWRIGSLNCGLSTFDHLVGTDPEDPSDIDGWRCVSFMAPVIGEAESTGTGGAGHGN